MGTESSSTTSKLTNMTETDNTIILAGQVVGFIHPTQGQIEAMIRIGQTLKAGTDDEPGEFWLKQIHRIGKLLDSLIEPGDQDIVDDLYLTGKISHVDLLTQIMAKVNANAAESEDKAIAKAKKATVRVQRK